MDGLYQSNQSGRPSKPTVLSPISSPSFTAPSSRRPAHPPERPRWRSQWEQRWPQRQPDRRKWEYCQWTFGRWRNRSTVRGSCMLWRRQACWERICVSCCDSQVVNATQCSGSRYSPWDVGHFVMCLLFCVMCVFWCSTSNLLYCSVVMCGSLPLVNLDAKAKWKWDVRV